MLLSDIAQQKTRINNAISTISSETHAAQPETHSTNFRHSLQNGVDKPLNRIRVLDMNTFTGLTIHGVNYKYYTYT